jgi:hypothetical protein
VKSKLKTCKADSRDLPSSLVRIFFFFFFFFIFFFFLGPAYPPRHFRQITNNGSCTFLVWEAAFLGSDKQRLFPAKVRVALKGRTVTSSIVM